MFEYVDGQTPDAGVTGILIAHLGAFGSGELKNTVKPSQESHLLESQTVFYTQMAVVSRVSQKICHVESLLSDS